MLALSAAEVPKTFHFKKPGFQPFSAVKKLSILMNKASEEAEAKKLTPEILEGILADKLNEST